VRAERQPRRGQAWTRPARLAAAVVHLLVPYYKEPAGKVIDATATEAALPKIRALHELLRGRFDRSSYQAALLDGVQEAPEDTGRQEILKAELAKAISQDREFAVEVKRLVGEAHAAGGVQITASDSGRVVGGRIRQSAEQGGVVVGGDIHGSVVVGGSYSGSYISGYQVSRDKIAREPPEDSQPPRRARRPGERLPRVRGDTTEADQSAVRPPRFLSSRMPRDVKTGSRFPLQVRVVLHPDTDVSSALLKPLEIPPDGAKVKLILYAPAPLFEYRSDPQQEVLVPAAADSEPVLFELEAKREGVHELEVTAWRDGTYLGALRMQVTVDRSVATDTSADVRAPLELRRAQGGGSVWITFEGGVYRYQLIRDNLPSEPLDSKPLRQTPREAIEQLVGELNAFARGTSALGPEDMRDRLVNRGAALWDDFMPEEFWDRFQTWRRDLTSLTVISRDQIVPWEILYPPNDEGFLVEQIPIFRWVTGPAAPAAELRYGRVGLVLPEQSPESAVTEIRTLRALLSQRYNPLDSVRSLAQLKRLLRAADFRVLHFACHNTFSQSGAKLLFGQQPFEPVDLKQYRRLGRPPAFATTAPLVFMNACRTADRAASYTSLDGWADAFVQAGAGAFIGSLWEVRDTTAGRLAEALYTALLDDHGPIT
jgi:CHAT domain